jgi:hypothetical protein
MAESDSINSSKTLKEVVEDSLAEMKVQPVENWTQDSSV